MFGFLLRALGCLVLAAGTAFAIGDIARSLSAEALRLTTMSEAAGFFAEEGWLAAQTAPAGLGGLWPSIAEWPVSPALAVLAFLLLLLGRRRREAEAR